MGSRTADNYLLNALMGRQAIISLCVYYDLYGSNPWFVVLETTQ